MSKEEKRRVLYTLMCNTPEVQKNSDEVTGVWLPTQRQLQELTELPLANMVLEFAQFAYPIAYDDPEASMEELWLRYYMWKCHNKVWTGQWEEAQE